MIKSKAVLLLTSLYLAALHIATAEDQPIEQYQKTVDELETQYGAYDIGLAEPLQGLGEALHANGDYQEAIGILKRGLHVRRVNDGITSFSQEPLLRLLNTSYQASGNIGAVATNYQQLLDLYQNQYGVVAQELVPLQIEAAQWHRQQYAQLRSKEAAAHLSESIRLVRSASNITSLGNSDLKAQVLSSEIENHYFQIKHYEKFAPRPPQDYVRREGRRFRFRRRDETRFEYQIAYDDFVRRETASLTRRYQREQIDNAESKALLAYERLNRHHQNNNQPLQQANTLVQQGDWLVLIDNNPQHAHTLYRKSWQLLTENNQLEERNKLFGKPQLLPVFDIRDPANFEQIARAKMDIDTTGRARNIAILETQPAEKSVARKAQRQLRDARFRSRLDNGEPTTSKGYELSLLVE